MANKQKFIAGIYNYCDRWCERCTLASRCRNYEGNIKASLEDNDLGNEKFWKQLSNKMADAMVLLKKSAEKFGLDLDNIPPEETAAYEATEAAIQKQIKKHGAIKIAAEYIKVTDAFFKNELSKQLVDAVREFTSHMHMGIKSEEDTVHTMATLGDCEQVIQWYLFFISVKLQRALHGKLQNDEGDDYPKDSDGSAKIALIAIERSMAAWVKMYELLPAAEDAALKALSLLQQMQQTALTDFPQAMAFKRPGFDD
jgi:hypothetical protein